METYLLARSQVREFFVHYFGIDYRQITKEFLIDLCLNYLHLNKRDVFSNKTRTNKKNLFLIIYYCFGRLQYILFNYPQVMHELALKHFTKRLRITRTEQGKEPNVNNANFDKDKNQNNIGQISSEEFQMLREDPFSDSERFEDEIFYPESIL